MELWIPFQETCRIVGAFLGKCGKNCQEEKRICKTCFIISLGFEEISLQCRNTDMFFINFAELWVAFFSDMDGIIGHKFEPKWHVPV